MGIGSYRHLVTFEHPTVTLSPASWYCSVQATSTNVIDGLAAFWFRGRYHPMIDPETRIVLERGGVRRVFQVNAVTDLEERQTDLQVLAVEVVGRGTTPGGA